jgi:hypothetical protein
LHLQQQSTPVAANTSLAHDYGTSAGTKMPSCTGQARSQNCSSSGRPELEEKPGRRPCPSRFSKWLEAPKRSKKLKIDRLVYPIHSNQNTQTWPFSAQSATQVLLGGEKTMASRHGCLAAPSNVPGILRAHGIPSICMYGNPNKNRKTWFPPL